MNFKLKPLFLSALLIIFVSCTSWQEPAAMSDEEPGIFPDYSGVTVPANIAPMNFMVEGAMGIQAVFYLDGEEVSRVRGKEETIGIPQKKWKEILASAKGKSLGRSLRME